MFFWSQQIPFIRSTKMGFVAVMLWCTFRSAPAGSIHGNSFRVQALRKLRMSYGRLTTDAAALTYCQQECEVFSSFCWPTCCYCCVMRQVVWQPPREAWQNSPKRVFLVLSQGKKCVWFTQLIWFVAFNSVPWQEHIVHQIPLFLLSAKVGSL